MLALLRGFMNTWPARLLILVMVAALGAWGIAGVFAGSGVGGDDVASVDGRAIRADDFDRQVRRDLEQVDAQFGSADQVPPGLRRMVAQQTLNRLIVQEAVQARAARMDLTVPDAELRDAVFAIPAFHGANGAFDRSVMNAALGRAGLSEPRFLQLMRDDMTQRELVEARRRGWSGRSSPTRARRGCWRWRPSRWRGWRCRRCRRPRCCSAGTRTTRRTTGRPSCGGSRRW